MRLRLNGKTRRTTLIDAQDWPLISRYRWYLLRHPTTSYAVTAQGDLYMHRLILNAKRGEEIDHKNGNGLDNRRRNLRKVTRAQNSANSKRHRDSASRWKGVSRDKRDGAWVYQLAIKGMRPRISGRTRTEREAALAYNAAARRFLGRFARLNKIT